MTVMAPDRAPQDLVAHGYDKVAGRYAALEGPLEWPRIRWLRRVLAHLAPGSRVLDVGCGSGMPATREIAQEHDMLGVDVSDPRSSWLGRTFRMLHSSRATSWTCGFLTSRSTPWLPSTSSTMCPAIATRNSLIGSQYD